MSSFLAESNSGDGWLEGPSEEFRWGIYGAAGAFILNPTSGRILLQQRAIWTAEGGTWGIPGGAINRDESTLEGALREVEEETGLPAIFVTVHGEYKLDLDWWSYTTFVCTVEEDHKLTFDHESSALEWLLLSEVEALPLHSAFAAALPLLKVLVSELNLES